MTQPIRIHATDKSDDTVRLRHAEIEKRLEELGKTAVQIMIVHGGLPTEWLPIVHAWLKDDKLEPPPAQA